MSTLSEFACITIRDWLSLQTSYGTATPATLIYSDGAEIPRQAIVINPTGIEQNDNRVAVQVSLLLDRADFTDSAHREAAAALRQRLCPAAPQYQPGSPIVSCHPDFVPFGASRTGGRVFDLLEPVETHTAQDGRFVYLLEFQAVTMLDTSA